MLSNRFPSRDQIAPVYAVILFITFAWTAIASFKLFSVSWIYFISVWDLIGLFAYQLVTVLIESLLVLAVLLALGWLLPRSWLKENFAERGSILALSFLGWLAGAYFSLEMWQVYQILPAWFGGMLLTAALLIFLSWKFGFVRNLILQFADRFIIFLYVLAPFFIAALIIVVIRNLHG